MILSDKELDKFLDQLNKDIILEDRNIKYKLAKYDNSGIKLYPNYLLGVRDTMKALGYDQKWLDTEFIPKLNDRML